MSKKITFVVGAGASREVGLPIGSELVNDIASRLTINGYSSGHGDPVIIDVISEYKQGMKGNYFKAAKHICDAMPQVISIDNFIDQHQGNEEIEFCGKLAIVRSILEAERNSLLWFDENKGRGEKINFTDIQDTWFNRLWKLMTENCKEKDLLKRFDSFSFIVFNYDRCIEHFLYNSLQNYYKLSPHDAAVIVNGLDIYHPYGTVGYLQWQNCSIGIKFGGNTDSSVLAYLSEQIKTFTEGTDEDDSEIFAIRQCVKDAKNIVFLGFAFHPLNIQLLRPAISGREMQNTNVYATAYNVSNSNQLHSMGVLANVIGVDIHKIKLADMACSELFDEYSSSLSVLTLK